MELDSWLAQLIKYTSAMELAGRGVSLDETIRKASQQDETAEADEAAAEERTFPGIDPMHPPKKQGLDLGKFDEPEQVPFSAGEAAQDEKQSMPPQPIDPNVPVMIPTDRLHPSRLTALATVEERDIAVALDRWRATRKLEPIVVRRAGPEPEVYEVVAGIDRWHAARRGHVSEVPVLIKDLGDIEALKFGLAARLKGRPVSALTEASTYLQLMTEASQTTEQVAELVGKPASHVAAMVRILNLPQSVRGMLERGEITVLHARALLQAHNPEAIARQVVAHRLDIYQTEQLVRGSLQEAEMVDTADVLDGADLDTETVSPDALEDMPDLDSADMHEAEDVAETGPPPGAMAQPDQFPTERPADASATTIPFPEDRRGRTERARPMGEDGATTELLERHLSQLLGLKVTISERENLGVIALHYTNRDQLSELIARLNRSAEK